MRLGQSQANDKHSLELEIDRLKRDLGRVEDELERARKEIERKEEGIREKERGFEKLVSKIRGKEELRNFWLLNFGNLYLETAQRTSRDVQQVGF